MTVTTYVGESELAYWKTMLEDQELIDLLSKANEINPTWALQPIATVYRKHWWNSCEVVEKYILYRKANNFEWQLINFPGNSDTSINHIVGKAWIQTFLYGVCASQIVSC